MLRLRIRFCRGEGVKFLAHLDLMRLWERALRRAGLSLAYSEGFSPHPRISLAAPLSVGVTSQVELMDVFLAQWISPHSFINEVSKQLPQSLTLSETWPVGLDVPSLQSQVRFAEYKVEVEEEKEIQDVGLALQSFLSTTELPWHHFRDTGARHYDLRALVDDLWFISFRDSLYALGMRLRCGASGTGRPEQVTKALGFCQYPKSIHRTELILAETHFNKQ